MPVKFHVSIKISLVINPCTPFPCARIYTTKKAKKKAKKTTVSKFFHSSSITFSSVSFQIFKIIAILCVVVHSWPSNHAINQKRRRINQGNYERNWFERVFITTMDKMRKISMIMCNILMIIFHRLHWKIRIHVHLFQSFQYNKKIIINKRIEIRSLHIIKTSNSDLKIVDDWQQKEHKSQKRRDKKKNILCLFSTCSLWNGRRWYFGNQSIHAFLFIQFFFFSLVLSFFTIDYLFLEYYLLLLFCHVKMFSDVIFTVIMNILCA